MIVNGKELDDVKVAEVAAKYQRNQIAYRGKGKLTFAELLARFMDDRNTMTKIADDHGVKYQMAQYIYEHYIRALLPGGESGRSRRKKYILKRLAIATREMLIEGITADVAREAGSVGCDVGRVRRQVIHHPGVSNCAFFRRRIVLNGKLCVVHHLTYCCVSGRGGKREYGHFVIQRDIPCDFRIVVTDFPGRPRKIFIVPSDVLAGKLFHYIPADNIVEAYNNIHPAIDWWQYEKAWHLLKA
jgi:hypothetical protein